MTSLDGSDRRLLFDATKYSICPHSLTYSPKLAQLLWVDPGKRRICSLNVATGFGSAPLKPETVVVDALPIPKSLAILPENARGSSSLGKSLWLTWLEPIHHSVTPGSRNHPVHMLYVPLDALYVNGAAAVATQKPLSPPSGPISFEWNSPNQIFLVPMRGGGLGDLSWHPCAGPSHGECSHFCLPKVAASSPSLPLFPGPLSPHPPLASPQPQSLWRTVRRCACTLGSHLLNTGSQSDGRLCSRIPYCLPPNMLCRAGLTTRDKNTRVKSYFLIGEPFPQRGACIPAHKVCDGVTDCQVRF